MSDDSVWMYWRPDQGETEADARPYDAVEERFRGGKWVRGLYPPDDGNDVAEKLSEYHFSSWEYPEWIDLAIKAPDGEVAVYEVEVYTVLEFSATKKTPSDPAAGRRP